MSNSSKTELIIIGGSAGSLPVVKQIIQLLPENFVTPLIYVVHRQRNVVSEFTQILERSNKNKKIIEPDDKEEIRGGRIYIAPQNYHLLIEKDKTISLDYSEAVRFSRPSIDVSFESASAVYKNKLAAVLLSGANNDGTAGLITIVNNGGIAVVQEPATAEYPLMPEAAIARVENVQVLSPKNICDFINSLMF